MTFFVGGKKTRRLSLGLGLFVEDRQLIDGRRNDREFERACEDRGCGVFLRTDLRPIGKVYGSSSFLGNGDTSLRDA